MPVSETVSVRNVDLVSLPEGWRGCRRLWLRDSPSPRRSIRPRAGVCPGQDALSARLSVAAVEGRLGDQLDVLGLQRWAVLVLARGAVSLGGITMPARRAAGVAAGRLGGALARVAA